MTTTEQTPADDVVEAVDVPDGYKCSKAQQIVWDWWCIHQNAVPICDDLNDLIWKLEDLGRHTMTEAELEREADSISFTAYEEDSPDGLRVVLLSDAVNLAKKCRRV